MLLGLLCALGSALCFGTASVFQAVAARRAAQDGGGGAVDPRLMARVLRQGWYLAGLGLDGLGFLMELVALRTVPIYVVGAALAASLAVTAVVAAWLLLEELPGTTQLVGGLVVLAGVVTVKLGEGRAVHLAERPEPVISN